MKRPEYEDGWDPPDDGWLYSGYWDLCVLFHKASKEFWDAPKAVIHPRGSIGHKLSKRASR